MGCLVGANGENEIKHRRVRWEAPVVFCDLGNCLRARFPFGEVTSLHLVDDLSVGHALRGGQSVTAG